LILQPKKTNYEKISCTLSCTGFGNGPNNEHDTEQQAEGMKTWMDWAQRCGDKLVDMGAPLMNGQVLAASGKISDSSKDVSGYSILEADSLQDAEKMLEGHPHISGWNKDATIEVHETMPLPGM
jgi:hypothetical protein